MGSAAPGPSRLRLRLFGLALLVVLPALVVVAVTADRDRTTWIAVAVASLLAAIAAWALGAIFIARPVARALDVEQRGMQRREELGEMPSDFVSIVSHELRNPMATIRGFGQMLRDQPDLLQGEDRQRAYEVIVRQVDRMASLVDNVLDASRIESESFEYAFIAYDVRDLLTEAVRDAGAAWPDNPIRLEANDVSGQATGDRDRLTQVMTNLLSNACRFSHPGDDVVVRARLDGPTLIVDVIDRGVGIDPAVRSRLFERLTRGGTPDTGGLRGTGLGLYISRCILEAHGGRISAASTPGAGSTFTMTVPLSPPAA